ncbi:hypothetical protein B0T09DRAFT_270190 [Sordaria sp. MPI-SDFR-AT-0083]|nr:hypothetical protein B0T09DRAFT_270190 [Sordaria sp. MPI-SDFR-AT-0083]
MHIHSLLALTLVATTSALPSLPECLMNEENRSRACREIGPVQSKPENFDGEKQQNRGGLQGQIEYVDQQIGKEIECPECSKNIVGDLAQSGSIGHNNMVTGQGEQQLDMINGKTHEEWIGMGEKQQDAMPHGQKSNFKIGQNQKRNQHFGQLFNGQSNTHGSMNMDTGKAQQDELIAKGQGMTQELYNGMGQANGRFQERDLTHNWGNQLYQGQNDQQEQFNKGQQTQEMFKSNGIIHDFNKGQGIQQLYNGQQMDNQLYKQWNNGPNDILMTTHQFYQGQPINTQELNKVQGQGIQQLYNGQQMDNQLYKAGQNTGVLMTTGPNHQQEQFNKGQQTQQLNQIGGQQTQEMFNKGQQTQEMFKSTNNNGIQARHEITQTGIAEHLDGQNKQGQQEMFSGPTQSKPTEEWIQNGKQQEQFSGQKQGQELFNGKQGQQELLRLVFTPQQMLNFVSSQGQQQWVREQIVQENGKQRAVWTCEKC